MLATQSMETCRLVLDCFDYVEQAWCGIYGMAPSFQTRHVVAVTLPTIAVIFLTYLWYKKRSNSVRGRTDPGGGGGSNSRKRVRHRNNGHAATTTTTTANIGGSNPNSINLINAAIAMPSVTISTNCAVVGAENFPEAMQKTTRDLETATSIREICNVDEAADRTTTTTPAAIEPVETHCDYELEKMSSKNDIDCIESSDVENSKNSQIIETETPHGDICDDDRVSDECDTSEPVDDAQTSPSLQPREMADSRENKTTKKSDDNAETTIVKLVTSRLEEKPKQKQQQQRKTNIVAKNYQVAKRPTTSTETRANGTKSPSGGVAPSSSQLLTSPSSSSSKSRKRKSKKKKSNDCGGGDSEVALANDRRKLTTKITADSKETSGTTIDKVCDSENAFDASETPVTATSAAAAMTRVYSCRVPENDAYRHVPEENSIRRSRKKSDKTDDYNTKVVEHRRADCDNERDSANHSPVDAMLDCQSVQFSDAHSEGSSDSGKGCSEGAASPTPQTPAGGSSISGDQNVTLLFQFVIPQKHVGKLIGKHGQFINNIKINSNTGIYIKEHPTSYKKKICALEGTQQEIQKALDLIRNRFPEETYPDISLEEFTAPLPMPCPLRPDLFQLDLVEGVNNDVVISSVVNAGHLFLQQPMHPTYQSLTLLNLSMNQVYNSPEAPIVLEPIKDNIVAAPAMDGWYRAQIISVDDETESCEVRFLDYGGYLTLSTSCLKAVRADFLTLPFQAVECFLANIAPVNDIWSEEAKLVVQSLTYGHILQAQVYDYTSDGTPLILLYAKHGTQVILINQELVARGFAYPITTSDGVVQSAEEYYVY